MGSCLLPSLFQRLHPSLPSTRSLLRRGAPCSTKFRWCSTKKGVVETEDREEWWNQVQWWRDTDNCKRWKELNEQGRDEEARELYRKSVRASFEACGAAWRFPEVYSGDYPAYFVVDKRLQAIIWRNKLNGDISRKVPIVYLGSVPHPPLEQWDWEIYGHRDMTGYEFRQYNMVTMLDQYCIEDSANKGLLRADYSYADRWIEYYRSVPWGPDHAEIDFQKFVEEQDKEWEEMMKRQGRDIEE